MQNLRFPFGKPWPAALCSGKAGTKLGRSPRVLAGAISSSFEGHMKNLLRFALIVGIPLMGISAHAAEQIKLTLGGKMEQYFFLIDADELPG